jgi:phosphate transport system substrate-binding protein
MGQSKNEIPALVLALGLTAAVVGGAFWWIKDSGVLNNGRSPATETISSTSSERTENNSSASNSSGSASNSSNGSTFADVADVPRGQFSYGGSTTWATVRGEIDPKIEQAVPGFDMVYKNLPGSNDGIQMLINRELAFAQSSRPLNENEKRQAQLKGMTLQEIPVALEAVAIATHPEISLSGLTLSQLKDIYTGEATNWNQFGGPNLAIVPASRGDSGTVQFFQESVLKNEPFASNIQKLPNTTAALRFISETPGSIYFASAPEVVSQCTIVPLPIGPSVRQLVAPYQDPYIPPENCPAQRNQLNLSAFQSQSYPLIRPLYVIVRKDAQSTDKAGIAYSRLLQTDQGQALLKQAGFVPLQ